MAQLLMNRPSIGHVCLLNGKKQKDFASAVVFLIEGPNRDIIKTDIMKISFYLPAMLAVALSTHAAQPAPVQPVAVPQQPQLPLRPGTPAPGQRSDELTRFDLDFPGGTPRQLVSAIQKAMGRPLNAVVPDEFADTKLPALKMNSVNANQLFQALEQSSHKSQAVSTGTYYGGFGQQSSYQIANTSYGFRAGPGSLTDDTIWCFYVEKPALPPAFQADKADKVCRFYSLAPYLDRHLTVDDITTAIETGWKMLGDTAPPNISFHKDTKLLIAVGQPGKLETIDAALKALDVPKPAPAASSSAPDHKPAEKAKSEE
jgi:hypothetical protein